MNLSAREAVLRNAKEPRMTSRRERQGIGGWHSRRVKAMPQLTRGLQVD